MPRPAQSVAKPAENATSNRDPANNGSGLDTGSNWIHLDRVWSNQRLIMTYDYVCTACAHAWEAGVREIATANKAIAEKVVIWLVCFGVKSMTAHAGWHRIEFNIGR